jgi:hypothetical protein
MDLQHPTVTQINRTGYPNELSGLENVVAQQECCGISFYGTEILEGDTIVIDYDNFDEIILMEDLKRYLIEQCNFIYIGGYVVDKNRNCSVNENILEEYLHKYYNFEFRVAE